MLERAFFEWLREGGAQLHGIEAAYVEEGWRGVVATTDIDPGSILVRVPEKLLVSVHSAHRDVAFRSVLYSRGSRLKSTQVLAAFLLYEVSKAERSFWHPYLLSLPRQYTCLSYFSQAEAEQLQVEDAKDLAFSVFEALRSSHKEVKAALCALGAQPKFASLAAWRWAEATVASRSMYLPDDEAGALTPFGDLHNHRYPSGPAPLCISGHHAEATEKDNTPEPTSYGSGLFDEEAQEYKLIAQTRYKKGDQIFMCYGTHTNLELLEHYGFVLDDNPHDRAKLPLKLLPSSLQGQVTVDACWLHPNGYPSWDLMKSLRLWAASQLGCRSGRHLAIEGKPINFAAESTAFKVISTICAVILQELPTTVDEDVNLLSDENLSECMRLAIVWRLSYKRTLQHAIAIAGDVLKGAEL